MSKPRLLTGDRPTGKLHLGHYVGSLANRVRLQDDYECYFLIADYHALTTAYEDLSAIGENVRELVLDYLSVGIDPQAQHDLPSVAGARGQRAVSASSPCCARCPVCSACPHSRTSCAI